MKDLFITSNFPPQIGGIEECVFNLCKFWLKLTKKGDLCSYIKRPVDNFSKESREGRGSKIVVLTQTIKNSQEALKFDRKQNFKIVRKKLDLPFRWLKPKWILSPLFAYSLAKKEKIQRVHAASGFASFISAYFLKKTLGLPYFLYVYGLDLLTLQKSFFKRWWLKRIFKSAEGFVANSNFTKKIMQDFYKKAGGKLDKKDKFIVLYPGVETKRVKDNFDKARLFKQYGLENKRVLLSVGRLVERKGFDRAIEAMPLVLKEEPKTLYCIIGDGPYRSNLESLIKRLDLQDKVKLLGAISADSLPFFYQSCSAFLMPSRFIQERGDVEGFGKVFLEANLFGKPVIGGNSGGVPEAVLDGQTGFLVNPESPKDIAEKTIKLLKDENLRIKMGEVGRKRAFKKFNWYKLVQDFKNKIENLSVYE